MNKFVQIILFFLILFGSVSIVAAPAEVKVIGLFKDKALLLIDGKRKLVSRGDVFHKMTLEYADSKRAIISYKGVSKEYQLGAMTAFQFRNSHKKSVNITANSQGLFYVNGTINGKVNKFLVDTGANTVSMNKKHAEKLGLDVKKQGEPVLVTTASSKVQGYRVSLKSIKIGTITENDVTATVIMAEQPETILLGMSFLSKVKISNVGNTMTLEQ